MWLIDSSLATHQRNTDLSCEIPTKTESVFPIGAITHSEELIEKIGFQGLYMERLFTLYKRLWMTLLV